MANYSVMQGLDSARKERGMSMRDVAKALGYHSATRIGKYFRQQIYAGPEMVRRLAIAVGMSPLDALWRAERYREVFSYFERLHRLGWLWMHKDRIHFTPSAGAIFAMQWEGVRNADINEVPPELAPRYTQATIYNEAGIFRVISVPKPIACAILLGIGMFCRRGDVIRAETPKFVESLSYVASDMLPQADRVKMPSNYGSFNKPLREAEKIIPWRVYGQTRAAVAAEYVQFWCDTACKPYADYARVALYEQGGFVGQAYRDDFSDENLWAWQRAELPSIENLKIT